MLRFEMINLSLFAKDPKSIQDNMSLLRLLADKKVKLNFLDEIRLPPPAKDQLKGNYHFGTVIYPDKEYCNFGFQEEEFIKHILIAGMTGTGKTNL